MYIRIYVYTYIHVHIYYHTWHPKPQLLSVREHFPQRDLMYMQISAYENLVVLVESLFLYLMSKRKVCDCVLCVLVYVCARAGACV
jgi:hypothetical protein